MNRIAQIVVCFAAITGVGIVLLGNIRASGPDQTKQSNSITGASRATDLDTTMVKEVSKAPDLKAGVTFEFGALDLSGLPEMLVIARLPFPEGLRFARVKLTYFGLYQDPNVKDYRGHLYSAPIGANRRFFLVCNKSQSIADPTQRFLVEYNDQGRWLATFAVRYAEK